MKPATLPAKRTISILVVSIFLTLLSANSYSQGLGIDASTPATKLDVNGDLALRMGSYTASNGNNNNINIGSSSFVRITGPGSAFFITGLAGGVNGKIVILYNATSQDMTISHQTTSSSANQILCSDNVSALIKRNGCATLIYSTTDSKWILVAIHKN